MKSIGTIHYISKLSFGYNFEKSAVKHMKREGKQRKERMTMVLHRNKSEQSKYLQTVIHLSLQIVVKHQQRSVVP